jgi:hypothetical protein
MNDPPRPVSRDRGGDAVDSPNQLHCHRDRGPISFDIDQKVFLTRRCDNVDTAILPARNP